MGIFADRLAIRVDLTAAEKELLHEFERFPVRYPAHQRVVRAGDRAECAFVVCSGWAMSYSLFEDGSQHVRRLHFPGDLLGMPSIPMRHYAEDIETLSDAVICAFDKSLLGRVFKYPRLAGLMYMFAQAERITAGDRLACLGSRPAIGRMAFLLLDILNRIRAAEDPEANSFEMHLTREQMSHVAGITPEHASRMWSDLRRAGLIRCEGPRICIVDEPGLVRLSGYVDRDADFDLAWLKNIDCHKEKHPSSHGSGSAGRMTNIIPPLADSA